jgi:hypothetical protein
MVSSDIKTWPTRRCDTSLRLLEGTDKKPGKQLKQVGQLKATAGIISEMMINQ